MFGGGWTDRQLSGAYQMLWVEGFLVSPECTPLPPLLSPGAGSGKAEGRPPGEAKVKKQLVARSRRSRLQARMQASYQEHAKEVQQLQGKVGTVMRGKGARGCSVWP